MDRVESRVRLSSDLARSVLSISYAEIKGAYRITDFVYTMVMMGMMRVLMRVVCFRECCGERQKHHKYCGCSCEVD